jgi:hypothetical protein
MPDYSGPLTKGEEVPQKKNRVPIRLCEGHGDTYPSHGLSYPYWFTPTGPMILRHSRT